MRLKIFQTGLIIFLLSCTEIDDEKYRSCLSTKKLDGKKDFSMCAIYHTYKGSDDILMHNAHNLEEN